MRTFFLALLLPACTGGDTSGGDTSDSGGAGAEDAASTGTSGGDTAASDSAACDGTVLGATFAGPVTVDWSAVSPLDRLLLFTATGDAASVQAEACAAALTQPDLGMAWEYRTAYDGPWDGSAIDLTDQLGYTLTAWVTAPDGTRRAWFADIDVAGSTTLVLE